MSELILHNPLDEPLPADPVDRIHRLARDLAWGSLNNLWPARVEIKSSGAIAPMRGQSGGMLGEYLDHWGAHLPSGNLLMAFDYLHETQGESASGIRMTLGVLTLRAFALLKKPVRTPNVYISYNRTSSSALALLIVARLRLVGVENPYMDMATNPGDDVHNEMLSRIENSDSMVCLLSPRTMESSYVQDEIQWALANPSLNIIPIWHNGYTPPHDYPPMLAARNAIRVAEESAESYNTAIIRMLNRLGYAP